MAFDTQFRTLVLAFLYSVACFLLVADSVYAQTNLAQSPAGTATQSSTGFGGVASRANDGNTNGTYSAGSVSHTSFDNEAWWQVDLGSVSHIGNIETFNRTDRCCGDRASNFVVFVSDVPFTGTTVASSEGQAGVSAFSELGQMGSPSTFAINRTGRYVRVQLRVGTNLPLHMAEVRVLGLAPTVTNVAANTGPPAGGTNVTITGANFTGATSVTIGGAAATAVTVVSATQITATTPAGALGSASVLVTTPSGTNAANTLFTYQAPEINVTGNGNTIVNGDATPAATDDTDFANVPLTGASQLRTFTIQNTGTSALSIPSNVTFTGANAADFTINAPPATSVAAGGSTTFQVRFDPSALGTRSAVATIVNNDSDENPYTFAIQGTGVDTSMPTLDSFARQTPATATTNADVLVFRATFDEDVQNVDIADFVVNGTTTATVTNVTAVSATVYDITVSGGDLVNFNGTVGLNIAAGQNIQDLATNDLPAGEPGTDETYNVSNDVLAPTLAITASNEARGPFTATFTFSEAVSGFTAGDIVVGNGAATNVVAASASVYTATITPGTNGSVTLDVGAAAAQDLAGNNSVAATQVTVNFVDETFVRTRTQRVISNFISRRSDQIVANEPGINRRLTRQRGSDGNSGPVGFSATGNLRNNRFNFATSLRQIATAQSAEKSKRREGLLSLGAAGSHSDHGIAADEGFDVWVQGKLVHTEDGTSDQELGLFYIGADYKLSSTFLFGVLAQYDWTDGTDTTQNTAAEGKGWLVGPYFVARLHENLVFDARVAYGRSDNNVRAVGTATDNFNGERWLAKGQLTGLFDWGKWQVSPSVGVIYFEEEQQAFTTTTGVFIPNQTIALGRVTFGPKISTNFAGTDGSTVSPFVSLKGLWDFEQAEQVDLTTGLATGTDDLRGRVEVGLSITAETGVRLTGEGFYDGIGANDFEAYGGSARMTFPLN